MKKLLLFCFNLLLFSNFLIAQGKLDYDHDSKWFWGFNYGGTWSTADVNYKLHNGWGITLGKSFNYNYGKVFSFDIRGRYLRGTWYGQNTDTSHFASNYSGIFSHEGMNYKDSLGFTIYNHKTTTNRLALELVIHANRIREKTGWDPYIFGGVGLTWYETKSNIIDGNSFDLNPIYQYDSTINYNVSSLKALHDNEYETSVSSFKPAFMPSLGFGLGYQIGKRVSIGIEHKTTFTMRDEWDGLIKNSQYKQDLYHYSGGYIRFQIRGGEREERTHQTHTPDPVTTNPNPINPTPTPENRQLPIVTYTNPSTSGTVVNSPNYTIRAEIKYVDGRNNISFKQDGQINTNFSFSNGTQLASNVILHEGNNVFVTTGTNQFGTDSEETIIIYKKQTGIPPIVTILNPKSNPERVSNQTFNFKGTVLNVNNAGQVSMTFNGQNFTSFTFNPTNKEVVATLNLREGSNVVVLNGTNEFGADSKTGNIIFEKPATLPPPIVTIINPTSNPHTVNDKNFNLESTVLNVSTNAQVKVVVNGKNTNNFTFDASTHKVNVPLTLNSGTNTILIKGTNTVGSDEKSTTIILRESAVILPPVVKFINPSSNPYSSTIGTYGVLATVLNVADKSAIQVIINGSSISNFNFNPSNKEVSFNVNLIEGNNLIKITGTNTAGTDSKDQTILYKKPATILPPIVNFIDPNENPKNVNLSNYTLKASVLNVNGSQEIQVKMNGNLIQNFNYNSVTKTIDFSVVLLEGANSFDVKAENSAGQDSKSTTIIYRKPDVVKPPFVKFVNPSVPGSVVKNSAYSVKATVENVTSISGIQVERNGTVLNSNEFTFDASTKEVSFNNTLISGLNNFKITGTNSAGSHNATTTIKYETLIVPCKSPKISWITPMTNNMEYTEANINIKAKINGVINSSQIKLILNGVSQNNFTYDAGNISFNGMLIENNNTIEIIAKNDCGEIKESRSVIYKKQAPCNLPTLTLVRPEKKLNTSSNKINIYATVTNIVSKEQITVKLNGVVQAFNFDQTNNSISAVISSLKVNFNKIEINVTNECGSASDYWSAIYMPCDAPTVFKISANIEDNTTTTVESFEMRLGTTVISSQNQITCTNNGENIDFSFDETTKEIIIKSTLVKGTNALVVKVTNSCGSNLLNYNITKIEDKNIIKPSEGGTIKPPTGRERN